MTTTAFTTPTRNSIAWGRDKLFRHYGVVQSGITIYKDATGWHEVEEGYEESVLDGATKIYYGGREYIIELGSDEYNDLALGGFVRASFYPSMTTFPSSVAFPGS